ncbi:MAG: hypothetical protein GF364_10715 [Candidatus Lokiarchaeota archaeon]|nr:hypothetical protein [Candidatus Lokiarchaeota archaeon]
MFEKARKLMDKYFNYLNSRFGEDPGISYGIYEQEGKLEIDLLLGTQTEKILGIRLLNLKKQEVCDFIRVSEDEFSNLSNLSIKEKKKTFGKPAITFHYEKDKFSIDHNFIIYSKGLVKKRYEYAEIQVADSDKDYENVLFKLDPNLYKLQVML